MNKAELIAAVAENADMTKKDAEKAVKAFVDVITEELKKGEKVQVVGFGTFEVPRERRGREETRIPARLWRLPLPKRPNSRPVKL